MQSHGRCSPLGEASGTCLAQSVSAHTSTAGEVALCAKPIAESIGGERFPEICHQERLEANRWSAVDDGLQFRMHRDFEMGSLVALRLALINRALGWQWK